MKLRLILIAIICLAIFGLIWFWMHSYLSITITNPVSGATSITLSQQRTGNTTKIKASNLNHAFIIGQGSYQLTIKQGDLSYVSIFTTKGLLHTTAVSATLKPEQDITFVGDNPDSCMSLLGGVLYSNNCNGSDSLTNIHVPANASQPTYTTPLTETLGTIESNTATSEGNLLLIAAPPSNDGTIPSAQVLYHYDMNGTTITPLSQVTLTNLDPSKTYTLEPYLNGFIAYDSGYTQLWYYPSMKATPTRLAIDEPIVDDSSPFSLSVSNDGSYAIAYTRSKSSVAGDSDSTSKGAADEIDVYHQGTKTSFKLTSGYQDVILCDNATLCLLDNNDLLSVKAIDGKRLVSLFSLANVSTIANSELGLLAVQPTGVLQLNIANQSGYIAFNLNHYQFCGLQPADQGYLLCVTSHSFKSAVYVNQGATSTTNIAQQVAQLRQTPQISSVSINNNFIYITPTAVSTVYDPTSNSYLPDPNQTALLNAAINKSIDKIKIDRSIYLIIITAPTGP